MSLHPDTSVQLAWAIANTEANLSGDDRIRPVHFFLAILKLIDPQFIRQLEGVDIPHDDHKRIALQSKQVRQYLEMSADEVTHLRRSIRGQLRSGKDHGTDIRMLHRSDESRNVFRSAAEKVVQAGADQVSILHLAEALFETGNIDPSAAKKIKGRPSSKEARWEVAKDSSHKGHHRFAEWYGRNLSRLAAENSLAPVVGRDADIRSIMRVLARTNRRHVALLGSPGVGKTAVVEGLALTLLTTKTPDTLCSLQVLELHGSEIAADCDKESELSRRLLRLFSVLHRHRTAVLFLDDFHGLFPPHLKPETALTLLTTILEADTTPCLVATTPEQWKALVAKAPSIARRFQLVQIDNPSRTACRSIAEAWAERIGKLQAVTFTKDALSEILKALPDLPGDRANPDRIVDLIENAATFVKVSALSSKTHNQEISSADILTVLSEHYGIKQERAPRVVDEM